MAKETVKFDPGFAPLVEHFSTNIDICHQILFGIKNFNQKKFKYKVLQPQIKSLIKNNVAFYLGCLLWAVHLVSKYAADPAEITGNSFYEMSEEDIANYDFLQEIEFIIAYLKTYERDSKYYLSAVDKLPEDWESVLFLYKEFLALNQGFVNVKTTNDIKIPEKFKTLTFDFDIEKEIEKSIEEKCIENLLNLKIFP